MHTIIIGANGQLGHDLVRSFPGRGRLTALTRQDVDVTDYSEAASVLRSLAPSHVINLAAFHQTDRCESEFGRAFDVNCYAALQLARACQGLGAALAYVSTDYVFDGASHTPYVETDQPNPLNVYGLSKHAGETAVAAYADKHFVFRVCGLYGIAGSSGKGANFVENRIANARAGKAVRIVNDQVVTPTHCRELAQTVWGIMATGCYGTYHLTQQGECSWYEFTLEILRQCGLSSDVKPQSTADTNAPARRPAYSVLDNVRLRALGLPDMKPWRLALNDYLVDRHGVARIKPDPVA